MTTALADDLVRFMFPLDDELLVLGRIAELWSRELPPGTLYNEVLERLVQDFWRGEFRHSRDDPRWYLGLLVRTAPHPGIAFYESAEQVPAAEQAQPDGSMLVDLTAMLVLPGDLDTWSDGVVNAACAVLAECGLDVYSPRFRDYLLMITVRREVFAGYCDAHRFRLPLFWFDGAPRERRREARSASIRGCRAWLTDLSRGPKHQYKGQYREEALRRFPNLTRNAFNRTWAAVVPSASSEAGVLKGKPGKS